MKILKIWLKKAHKARQVLELAPLGLFFIVFHLQGLLPATACLVVATLISLIVIYYAERRIAVMPLLSGLLVTIFGSLTLWLHDDTYIKIKPTIVNLLFATLLLGGVWMGKPMLKYLLNDALTLSERGWKLLSLRWGFFFIFLAGLNEFIWRSFSTDFWVSFKVFGMFSLVMLFTLGQLPLIKRYWVEEKTPPQNGQA